MTEMKTNESLASYEAEYTRLYEALYKSNQIGVELNMKLAALRVCTQIKIPRFGNLLKTISYCVSTKKLRIRKTRLITTR